MRSAFDSLRLWDHRAGPFTFGVFVALTFDGLDINRVPAVVINGQLADCCSSGAIDVEVLRTMGLGHA